ncbi:MAG: sodium-dependent transporter [Lacipirellulaceae bacterium]
MPLSDDDSTNPTPPPTADGWSSRLGVILAVAGSAVGLGNFLRFPGQAADNGGGAFMIPYFVSLLLLGIPLCWAEWTMGRYGGSRGFNSAPGVFSVLWRNPLAKYLGVLALVVPLVIYMYYVVIEAWCLAYAIQYLTGDLMLGPNADKYQSHFDNLIGNSADGVLFSGGGAFLPLVVAAVFAMNFVMIYRGVSKGIESFCKIAMPVMAVCALIVLVRVMTLPAHESGRTVEQGLGYMWNPDFSKLGDSKTWLAASGQVFFSLSVGFGIIVNYASYLKRKDDVVLSGLTSSSVNELFEVAFGGMITIPAAFVFLGAAGAARGFGLGFVSLPNVFAEMPGGRLVGFLWFFMLFLAAITSSLSMLQPVIAFLEEGFGLRRRASATLLGMISALGTGIVLYFSKDRAALDTFDFWVGTLAIVVLALVQSLLYGWGLGIRRGAEIAAQGAQMRIPHFVQLLLKYVIPLYLATMVGVFCYNDLPDYFGALTNSTPSLVSGLFILVVIAFMTVLVHLAGMRWVSEGRYEEGEQGEGI